MDLVFHSLDSNENKVFFRTEYQKKENTYIFPDKTDTGTVIQLTLREKEVLFERIGNTNMQLLLSLDNMTLCHYENNIGLKFDFYVKTTKLNIDNQRLEMEYSLYLEDDMLSMHKIWVLFH